MSGITLVDSTWFGTDGDDVFDQIPEPYSGRTYRYIGGEGVDVILFNADSADFTGGANWFAYVGADVRDRFVDIEILRFDDRDVLVADLPDGAGVELLGDQDPDHLRDELVYDGSANVTVSAGLAKDDVVHRGDGALTADLGRGDDHLFSNAWHAQIRGGRGDDFIEARSLGVGSTVRGGGGGDDLLIQGHAAVYGGKGDDLFRSQNFELHGGRGDDVFQDWQATDSLIDGGAGFDTVIHKYDRLVYTVTIDGLGAMTLYSYDPEQDFERQHVFTDIEAYVGRDGETLWLDGRPIAEDDRFLGRQDETRRIDADALLENDLDLAELGLDVVEVGNARNGVVELDGDKIVFTPDEGFVGRAAFDYVVENDAGQDTARVILKIREAEPDPQDPWPYDDASAHDGDLGLL